MIFDQGQQSILVSRVKHPTPYSIIIIMMLRSEVYGATSFTSDTSILQNVSFWCEGSAVFLLYFQDDEVGALPFNLSNPSCIYRGQVQRTL